jgi:hypothetical protein
MDDKRAALVERALEAVTLSAYEKGNNLQLSTEDLTAAIDLVRDEVLEEAARVADVYGPLSAAAIRSLKGDNNG